METSYVERSSVYTKVINTISQSQLHQIFLDHEFLREDPKMSYALYNVILNVCISFPIKDALIYMWCGDINKVFSYTNRHVG